MKQQGFSLLEMLIVLCIMGILIAFAIPNFTHHFTQQRRLAAETALMQLAGYLEAYYAEHNTYEGADFNTLKLPEFVANNNYRLLIQTVDKTQFKLAAIPQNQQASHDALCGSLLLNSRGEKHNTGYGNLNECW